MKLSKRYCRLAAYVGAFLAVSTIAGCYSGSRGWMRFDELKYPVSMSAYLYGPNQQILTNERELLAIKKFTYTRTFWGTFYSLAPLSGTVDVSNAINAAIQEAGGDGIVNIKIVASAGFMTYLHPFTLLPIWPSYTKVDIEGDIVQHELQAPTHTQTTPIQVNTDVLIIETMDPRITANLHEQCLVIGKVDTHFVEWPFWSWTGPNAELWRMMYIIKEDEGEQDSQTTIKTEALKKGANVAQILYITLDRGEVNAKLKSYTLRKAAIDVRYWACP